MSNRFIYIFIEVARRELDWRMALAVQLAKKGYSVVVGEKNQLLWNMFVGYYPPGVILDKCAQIATSQEFENLICAGFVYTVLDEEGLITNAAYFNQSRFSSQAEKFVSANFVTGKNLDSIIKSQFRKANNIITGNPRYSMLHPEWQEWFSGEYNQIKTSYKNFVLLVSSFNPYPQVYKHVMPGMKEIDDYFKSQMSFYLDNHQKDGLNFVLRPHPSDQPYHNNSVQTDERFNIIPWIRASEYIVNAKCTTSIEAFIAGKRAYTWKLLTHEPAYKLANLFADDLHDFGCIVLDTTQNRRKKILSNLLAHADSAHDSMNLICETIEKLSFPQSKSKSKSKFSVHKLMHLKNQIRFMMKGDNYTRIKQKFTEKDVAYAHKKMSLYISNYTINDKVFEINC